MTPMLLKLARLWGVSGSPLPASPSAPDASSPSVAPPPATEGATPTDEELEAAHLFLRAPRPVDARVAMIELDRVCGGSIVRMDAALAKASAEYRANLLLDRLLGSEAS